MPHRKSADPRSVRAWNEVIVVQSMLEAERSLRISGLAELTGLTPATLGQVLRGLGEKGWVRAENCPERGRGRPAQVYSVSGAPGCVLDFDLGVHAGRVVKLTLEGREVARNEMRLGEPTEENRWQGVADLVGSVYSPEDGPVWLAAVASGLVRDQEGRPGDLRSHETHPVEMVPEALGVETLVFTDVQAETWASREVGVGHGYANVVHLHLGRRPKVGLVINDEVRRGIR